MAVVTLLSDFVDGGSMALSEETDASSLSVYMTTHPGRLWSGVKKRRLARGLTRKRRGPGTLYFAPNSEAQKALEDFLQTDTGSEHENQQLMTMKRLGIEISPHIAEEKERSVLIKGKQISLTPRAQARGFG